MTNSLISRQPLTHPWQGQDPFLFAVHHLDHYPAGNGQLGLRPEDLAKQGEGWSMYHGKDVPGFPAHPHRGFETVTIVLKGLVDHADSLGGAARYGEGDVQWLTTGAGVEHGEMFPLTKTDGPNTLELFQIWLNLPPEQKMAEPDFDVFWAETIPVVEQDGARVSVIAGAFDAVHPLSPPKASWAALPENHLAIWLIDLEAGASLTLPTTTAGILRRGYVFEGAVTLDGQSQPPGHQLNLDPALASHLTNQGQEKVRLLVLQAKPIGAPVLQHGPFVLNSREEMIATIQDYQSKGFGHWPWNSPEQTHGTEGRFVLYPDGRRLTPPDN